MSSFQDELHKAVTSEPVSATSSKRWVATAKAFSRLLELSDDSVLVKGLGTRPIFNVISEVLGKQFGAKRRVALVVLVYDDNNKDKKLFADSAGSDMETIEDWVARGAFKAVVVVHVPVDEMARITHLIQAGSTDLRGLLLAEFPKIDVKSPKAQATYLDDVSTVVPDVVSEPQRLDDLAEHLHVPFPWLDEVVGLLRDGKAMVLYGPPGTGKSYIAQAIVRFLQPRADLRRLVQLHPSFAYESFFEGYRPAAGSAGMTLKKVHGPLRRLASALENEPLEDGFLILDEMNRGNLPKVFGELYFLLEYRHATVELMYSEAGDEFGLPNRLHLVGTMNTADRSVSALDQALRRRFSFVPLYPDAPPLAPSESHPGMLRHALLTQPDMAWVADVLDRLNGKLQQQLSDRDVLIGPSYFLGGGLNEATVERRWKYFVLPSVQAALGTDDPSEMEEYSLEALRAELA